jgi:DNA-binding transcriptional ArsR family regulator
MVSGDWGRHPDTVIRLEKDADRAATRWTLTKARPADPNELGRMRILEWDAETLGYRFVEKSPEAVGAENREKVFAAVETGHTDVEAIAEAVELAERTVQRHLKALAEDGRLRLGTGIRGSLIVVGTGDEMTLEAE